MTHARAIYRDYFMDSEKDPMGWRVVAIPHSLTGRTLLPPAFLYPDLPIAEQYAKAAIDGQLSKIVPRRRCNAPRGQ
jgi:hypothetical protein